MYWTVKIGSSLLVGSIFFVIGGEALAAMWPGLFGQKIADIPLFFFLEDVLDDGFLFGHVVAVVTFTAATIYSGALIESYIANDIAQLHESPKLDPDAHRIISAFVSTIGLGAEAVLTYRGALHHAGWGSHKSFDAFVLTCLYMSVVLAIAYLCARIKYGK